ncbi:MAG: hypothetical protein MOB07_23315 [Acidobacteria bacterium]|nr:hypothetical protein [Acidobacteriota bacterium]
MPPIKLNTLTGQTAYYYSRRRRKGLLDPASVLFTTHRYTTADTNINTATVFGDAASRTRPVTFAFALTRSGVGAGIVFEFGSTTRGVAVWVSGNNVGVAAGTGTATPNNGVTLAATNALPATGQRFQFVLAINPGDGRVELWRNGLRVASGQSVAGTFGGEWADTNNGAVGNLQGTVNDRVPVGERVALANVAIVGPLKVYLHQRAGA